MKHTSLALSVVLFLAVSPFLLACAKTQWHQLEDYSFGAYVKEFNKQYRNKVEFAQRMEIFEARLAKIREHNKDTTKTWKEGVNHLTDRTDAELKSMRGYRKEIAATISHNRATPFPESLLSVQLPASIDWREKGIISPVKDQGQCGSCWTFATAETIESMWAMATENLPILSEQQILDCTPNPDQCGGTGGCGGGTAELAMQRIMDMGGLSSEWTYAYNSYWGAAFNCKFTNSSTPPAAKIQSYVRIPSNVYDPLMQAVATVGPIAISVDASAWNSYESGVFNGCNQTNPDIDHAVQLVGYGTDSSLGDFWIVRNSWSPAWGEHGYIRLHRSSDFSCGIDIHPSDGTGCKNGPPSVRVCGTCGILYDNSYPIIGSQ